MTRSFLFRSIAGHAYDAARGAASVSGDMRHAVGTNTRLGEGGGWSAALEGAGDASSLLGDKRAALSASARRFLSDEMGSARIGGGGISERGHYVDDAYCGVKQASVYLREQGVPRRYRKQILESFDARTIKLETAGKNTYGLRFYGGSVKPKGRYLFETFSPLSNRDNLALPFAWNSMAGIRQFKVKSGTIVITGAAAPQLGFGARYVGGAKQWYVNDLEDLIICQ